MHGPQIFPFSRSPLQYAFYRSRKINQEKKKISRMIVKGDAWMRAGLEGNLSRSNSYNSSNRQNEGSHCYVVFI